MPRNNGLIARLTEQVVRKAFASATSLIGGLFLTVNVSPSELCSGRLGRTVRDEADRAGFQLDQLILEITEALLIEDRNCALATVAQLREMGCRLALDDFGTGHSSLSYLQELPFYCLKIDRSFVAPMMFQRQSRKIVASVVGLSTNLGMRSVGEGVETEEQADVLLWLGCDMAQGWLYGRPESAEALPRMVSTTYSSARTPEVEGDGLQAYPDRRLAQLQAIYRGVPAGLCFLDMHQRYVSLNQRYADYVGRPKPAFIGKTVEQMVPDSYPVIRPLLDQAAKGESVVNEEIRVSASKTNKTVLVSYEPVRDEADELIGISVAVLDISDRHPLPADHEDGETAANGTQPMHWIRDANGELRDVSPQWLAVTGMTRKESLKEGYLQAIHPDDRARALDAVSEAIRTRKPYDVTCKVITRKGDTKVIRVRGYPRYESDGRFVGWYGGTEDVEERARLERALQDGASS